MATIINNPGTTTSSDNGTSGLLVGLVVFILVVLALAYFGVPYFRRSSTLSAPEAPKIENNVQGGNAAPPAENGGTQINVPDKVDVNVKTQ